MKRKTTHFQQLLEDNGWELHSKKYCGKHKDRILSYVYTKEFAITTISVLGILELNKSDLKVLNFGFQNHTFGIIDKRTRLLVESFYVKIMEEIASLEYQSKHSEQELSVDEQVQVVESVESTLED